jgi:HemY protein
MARALNARRDPAWTADAFVSDHWLPISPVSGRLDAFEWKDPLAGEDHGAVIEHRAEAPAATIATSDAARAADAGKAAAPGVTSPRVRGEVDARSASGEGPPPPTSSQQAPHPHPLPAGGEREPARQADEPAQQADKPASEEKEKAQRAAEEAAHPDPFSAGGRSARRAMAAATADESRAPRGRAMTPVVPAVIPLVPPPDDPGPNGETEVEPAPEPAPPPADGWSRIRALFRP